MIIRFPVGWDPHGRRKAQKEATETVKDGTGRDGMGRNEDCYLNLWRPYMLPNGDASRFAVVLLFQLQMMSLLICTSLVPECLDIHV